MAKWQRYASAVLSVVIAMGMSACTDHHGSFNGGQGPTHFESEGEQIYFTGTSSSGEQIRPVGGNHHMQMHGGSCATCHGADREGGDIMWPRFWVVAPALTVHNLTGDHDDDHDHAAYDESSLKRAIVKGVGPDGEKLHDTMPRWKMSEKSLNALVHYLLSDNAH